MITTDFLLSHTNLTFCLQGGIVNFPYEIVNKEDRR